MVGKKPTRTTTIRTRSIQDREVAREEDDDPDSNSYSTRIWKLLTFRVDVVCFYLLDSLLLLEKGAFGLLVLQTIGLRRFSTPKNCYLYH